MSKETPEVVEYLVYTDHSPFLKAAGAIMIQEFEIVGDTARKVLLDIVSAFDLSRIANTRTVQATLNSVTSNSSEVQAYLISCIFLIKTVIGVEEYDTFVKRLKSSATTMTEYNKNTIDEKFFGEFLRDHEWYVALILMRMFAVKLIVTHNLDKVK